MKPRLLKMMVCPLDRTELELVEWESRPREVSRDEADRARRLRIEPADLSREIVTGVLLNRGHKIAYRIYGGIPRMLVFETGVSREFWLTHGSESTERFLASAHRPIRPCLAKEMYFALSRPNGLITNGTGNPTGT